LPCLVILTMAGHLLTSLPAPQSLPTRQRQVCLMLPHRPDWHWSS